MHRTIAHRLMEALYCSDEASVYNTLGSINFTLRSRVIIIDGGDQRYGLLEKNEAHIPLWNIPLSAGACFEYSTNAQILTLSQGMASLRKNESTDLYAIFHWFKLARVLGAILVFPSTMRNLNTAHHLPIPSPQKNAKDGKD
jgi:hypothetical protein